MQPLTDPFLRPYTAAQIIELLTGPAVQVTSGLELLDATNLLVEDMSADLESGSLSRSNYATIHGTATFNVSRALAWGRDRVRPYMILTDAGVTARWNLGVYVMSTPHRVIAETPGVYQVTGSDLLYLLDSPIGDTYVVTSGTGYLAAVRSAINAAGGGTRVLLDGTAEAKTLPADMVWPLTQSTLSTWLDVINKLLKAVGYRGIWCDWDGNYTSEPYQNPTVRAPEFTFDADDADASIVGASRTVTNDLWQAPNWWRFIASTWPTTPAEGSGQYTVQNASDGPSSQASIGRTVRKVVFVTAADQASLQALGDQTVSTDKRVAELITATLSPSPMQWHMDVAEYVDTAAGGSVKVLTHQWTLDLAGADGQTQWEVV